MQDVVCNDYGILQTQGSHLHPILRASCLKVADTPSRGVKPPLYKCVPPNPIPAGKLGHISVSCVLMGVS